MTSTDEVERAKGQVRGTSVLSQEDTAARMTRLARSQMHDEPLLSIPALLDKVDAVTMGEVHDLARDLLLADPRRHLRAGRQCPPFLRIGQAKLRNLAGKAELL